MLMVRRGLHDHLAQPLLVLTSSTVPLLSAHPPLVMGKLSLEAACPGESVDFSAYLFWALFAVGSGLNQGSNQQPLQWKQSFPLDLRKFQKVFLY